jgi:hypothetical protein
MRNMLVFFTLMGALSIPLLALPPSAPEIDAASGAAAIGLIGGAILLIRSRKKK